MIWLIMEAIVFFTIPMMLSYSKNSINSESVVMYFIYQAIARILIISGILRNYMDLRSYLFIAGVFVKLGMFPFHLWVLPVLSGCRYLIVFTLLIPVKLPMYILRDRKRNLVITISILRMIVGLTLAMNQSSLIKIIIRSSISSSGVLVTRFFFNVFKIYFIIYSLTLLFFLLGLFFSDRRIVFLSLISFLGIPFLPIFIPKLTLLMKRLICIPFLSMFLLLIFLISSLYYVKYLPIVMNQNITWRAIITFLVISFVPYL